MLENSLKEAAMKEVLSFTTEDNNYIITTDQNHYYLQRLLTDDNGETKPSDVLIRIDEFQLNLGEPGIFIVKTAPHLSASVRRTAPITNIQGGIKC